MRVCTALVVVVALVASNVAGRCPYGHDGKTVARDRVHKVTGPRRANTPDFRAVVRDLEEFMTTPQPFWPPDFGTYAGLMIRLAWHCAGSYRRTDGRGGCDGSRIRHNPEMSWPDNTNLDKALRLLEPVKARHPDVSWGDLIILAGNTAITSMGGTVVGFCGGRVDDVDGTDSLELGPSPKQEKVAPCEVNGMCEAPLGPTTIGLIYVNPEGPMGLPNTTGSAVDIRSSFTRMGMSDRETVALVGGGHAFGKNHGACPSGPGPGPLEQPDNPWPGTCGSGPLMGIGPNAFTSGLEGAWTNNPTMWDNDYFKNLLDFGWEVKEGPGGGKQWFQKGVVNPQITMLTSDLAFLEDPSFLKYVRKYARDLDALTKDFSETWYKLTSSDMGPVTRCIGNMVPSARSFQNPLPPSPRRDLPDMGKIKHLLRKLLFKRTSKSDRIGRRAYNGALFSTLAYQCASTFRATDYRGGCNGASIRFPPQSTWQVNQGLDEVLKLLAPVQRAFGNGLSWADLIVLAGQVAIEDAGVKLPPFCGGRVDAKDGSAAVGLEPRTYSTAAIAVKDNADVMGLTDREVVALAARLRSARHQKNLGFSGSISRNPRKLSTEFYSVLLNNRWMRLPGRSSTDEREFKAQGRRRVFITESDLVLVTEERYKKIVEEFAGDEDAWRSEFASAWSKLMIADRFHGPDGNVCT